MGPQAISEMDGMHVDYAVERGQVLTKEWGKCGLEIAELFGVPSGDNLNYSHCPKGSRSCFLAKCFFGGLGYQGQQNHTFSLKIMA